MSVDTVLITVLIALVAIQVATSVPLLARLIIETVNYVDLRLNYSTRLPFDWRYVVKGR